MFLTEGDGRSQTKKNRKLNVVDGTVQRYRAKIVGIPLFLKAINM